MGKWAQYSKRGSARHQGALATLAPADWSIGVTTATTIPVNRIAGFPNGADRWGVLVVKVSDGSVVWNTFGLASPITATGLTTGTAYRVYTAWFVAATGQRASDWSAAVAVTTP